MLQTFFQSKLNMDTAPNQDINMGGIRSITSVNKIIWVRINIANTFQLHKKLHTPYQF